MSARILVIGWKKVAEDALDRAGIPHITLVKMSKYAKVRSRADADRILLPCGDVTNVEALLGSLERSGVPISDIVAVWTTDEFAMVAGSALAQILGLRSCIDVVTALRFRDKYIQKQIISAAGLPVARTALLACEEDLRSPDVTEVGFPAIIKPVAGAGTSHTHRVDTPDELRERLGVLLGSGPDAGPFLLESFVAGGEMHLDGHLVEGRLNAFAASRYLTNNLDIQKGGINGSYMLDPKRSRREYAETEEFALACLHALGLTHGVFHMEVFLRDDGLYFSECAARAGGGGIIEVFQAKFGLNLVEEHAKGAMSLPPGSPAPSSDAFGCTLLRARPGIAVQVPTTDELLGQPGVTEGTVDQAVGEPTPDMTENTVRRAGSAILSAPTEDELVSRIHALRAWFADAVVTEAASDPSAEPTSSSATLN